MATVSKERDKVISPKKKPRSGNSRRMRPLLWLLAGLTGLIWAAPMIVAYTPLRQQVLASLMPGLNGSITAESASLGWFSPVVFNQVRVHDAQGELLLEIPRLAGQRMLLGIAADTANLGHFQADDAQVKLIFRHDVTNAEEVLLPWWNAPSTSEGIDLSVELTGANISIHDAATNRQWELDDLSFSLALVRSSTLPTRMAAAGNIKSAEGSGTFSLAAGDAAGATALDAAGELRVKCDALPLAMVEPVLRRFAVDLELSGGFGCDLQSAWQNSGNEPRMELAGQFACDNLLLAGPALGGDRLQLARMSLPCRIERVGDRINVSRTGLDCDLGNISFTGSTSLSTAGWQEQLASLLGQSFRIEGNLDLARLAAAMPRTLSIRPGTQITSGELQLMLDSRASGPEQQWTGELTTSNLLATHAGRQIRWDQPVHISLAAHRGAPGAVVDQLRCQSSFLQAEAAGTLREFTATAQCDLNRLQAELAQFLDLGELTLAGQGQADLRWTSPGDRFEMHAGAQVTNFALTSPGRPAWTEQRLVLAANAAGQAGLAGIKQIEQATFNLTGGEDRLDARLLSPVQPASTTSAWPIEISLQGDLARWSPRINPILPLNGWELGGQCDLNAQVHYGASDVEVRTASLDVRHLHAWGHGLFIDEPALQMQTSGKWQLAGTAFELGKTTFATSSLSWGSDRVTIAIPDSGLPTVKGAIDFRGDLERLYRWANDPRVAANWRPVGQFSGRADLSQNGSVAGTKFDSVVESLALYRSSSPQQAPVWQEQQLKLGGKAQYDSANQTMTLKGLELTSQALHARIGGQIDNLTTTRDVNLQGELAYDLRVVTELLRPYVGDQVRLAGRDQRKFNLQGPLGAAWKEKLTAQASAGWKRADIYGVQLGPGAIDARLAGGVIGLGPLDLPLSDGKLTLAPQVRLAAEPMDLVMGSGPVLQRVKLTPEMCHSALKYVAPVLAEATRAEGLISIDVSGARIPLSNPAAGDVAGRLAIHSVAVTPGPLTDQILLAARQIEAVLERRPPPAKNDPTTLLRLAEQNVDFRMVDHRVHHQGVQATIGKVTIRTRGSVGLDQTLSLVAEVPVLDEWVSRDPLLAGMRGQMIQVPIAGTLSKPKMDPRTIEQLAKQVFRSSTESLIREGVNRGLERLFNEK